MLLDNKVSELTEATSYAITVIATKKASFQNLIKNIEFIQLYVNPNKFFNDNKFEFDMKETQCSPLRKFFNSYSPISIDSISRSAWYE